MKERFILAIPIAFVCPDNNQFSIFADRDDNSKYFQCDYGVASHLSCPAEKVFNTELNTCTVPFDLRSDFS